MPKSGRWPPVKRYDRVRLLTEHQRRFDLVVVGAGAIGLAIAWRAASRGLRVGVLERGAVGRGASWVAAGMLAPVTEARLTEVPLLELGVASAALYPKFAAELQEQAGIDPGYQRYGTLVVAGDRDQAEALERELEVHRRLGLDVTRLRSSQARALEPALPRASGWPSTSPEITPLTLAGSPRPWPPRPSVRGPSYGPGSRSRDS